MKSKLTAVEIMYHASSYAHLSHSTNYDCETAALHAGPYYNPNAYQINLAHYTQKNSMTSFIHARESARVFSGEMLSQLEILHLLFNGYSLKSFNGSFTVPQAGALAVMLLVVLENKQTHWESRRYDSINYTVIHSTQESIELASLFYTKSVDLRNASHCIIIASQLKLFSQIYLARAYKFACIQAGHIAQNIIVTATSKKIKTIPLGSLIEDQIIQACGLNADEFPLYAVLLGK